MFCNVTTIWKANDFHFLKKKVPFDCQNLTLEMEAQPWKKILNLI